MKNLGFQIIQNIEENLMISKKIRSKMLYFLVKIAKIVQFFVNVFVVSHLSNHFDRQL